MRTAASVPVDLTTVRIGFLGAGSIVEAMLAGIVRQGLLPSGQIAVTNRSDKARLESLARQFGVQSSHDKQAVIEQSDVLILAMKPKDTPEACMQLRGLVRPDQLVISVISGISSDLIAKWLDVECPIVRTMPNTSSAVSMSVTGVAKGRNATDAHVNLAVRLFEAIGFVHTVKEEELDIITGLSGSGPAYIYYLIEAMEAAGQKAGLPAETARKLVVQTLAGAAQMLLQTKEDPAKLRRNITSPGGTTQAALEVLDARDFQDSVQTAVLRAMERSRELGEQFR